MIDPRQKSLERELSEALLDDDLSFAWAVQIANGIGCSSPEQAVIHATVELVRQGIAQAGLFAEKANEDGYMHLMPFEFKSENELEKKLWELAEIYKCERQDIDRYPNGYWIVRKK